MSLPSAYSSHSYRSFKERSTLNLRRATLERLLSFESFGNQPMGYLSSSTSGYVLRLSELGGLLAEKSIRVFGRYQPSGTYASFNCKPEES